MVQMKGERLYKAWITSFFISHMVQMKALLFASLPALFYFFISHMVQMKVRKAERKKARLKLFISHMVQMKELLKECGLLRSKTLYPTWFR